MKNNFARAYALISQLSISIIVNILIGMFIGKWIDSKLYTTPLFLIIFIILGLGAAFRTFYVMVKNTFKG